MSNKVFTPKVAVLIPTLNAGKNWDSVLNQITLQRFKVHSIIIIDSESDDNTIATALKYKAEIVTIERSEFSHGYARDKLIRMYPGFDIYLFFTQDALLASPLSIGKLVAAFNDPDVGVAYGRQIPNSNATLFEVNNRNFNYPETSITRSASDVSTYGFKTIFCSNSFAAYRSTAYANAGGFSLDCFFGEDTLLAAKMIENGWKIAYKADATVYHSHNFTLKEEFKRSFEIGMFHKENLWLITKFGKPVGEGIRLFKKQLKSALAYKPFSTLSIIGRFAAKWLGYKLGCHHQRMPAKLQKSFSIGRPHAAEIKGEYQTAHSQV